MIEAVREREQTDSAPRDGALLGEPLSIEALGRRFGSRDVIRSLSLRLGMGERLALRGPNGSGKTTVLRCVAGTVTPTRGQITVAGFPAGTLEARSLIGVALSQERSFYLRLTGRANLLCFARMRHGDESAARSDVDSLIDELSIAHFMQERMDTYSSGMLQQVTAARAFLGNPAVLLLDEPTRSLDEQARARLWDAVDRRPQLTVLIATHDHDDVARCHSHIDLPA